MPLGMFCRARWPSTSTRRRSSRSPSRASTSSMLLRARYPFGKYDQLFVPEFNAGAMENAGGVTFLEDYVFRSRVTDSARELRGDTILHEMAHMWFGDLVTMRWWDDLWLNESFATLAAAAGPGRGHPVDRRPGPRSPAAEGLGVPAGPAAVHAPDRRGHPRHRRGRGQLRRHHLRQGRLGAQAARRLGGPGQVPRRHARYFGAHAWGNATLSDLLAALEEVSGRDLSGWAKEWLETAGVNTLRPDFSSTTTAASRRSRWCRRAGHPRDAARAPARDRPLRAHRGRRWSGGPDRAGRRRRAHRGARAGRARQPDLLMLNDDDLTYAKMRLDQPSLAHPDHRHRRVQRLAARRAVLGRRLGHEPRRGDGRPRLRPAGDVRGGPLRATSRVGPALLRQATPRCAGTPTRPGGRTGSARLPGPARPGRSGPRPVRPPARLLQAFASLATSPGDLALLAGLLDGSAQLDGLVVDTELRWRLLHRLASQGAAGPAEIDAELRRDATDAGQRRAATCRAAIPEAAAKEAAWAAIVSGTLPNAMFRATLNGFADPDQAGAADALRRPGTSRWSATCGGTGAATWPSGSPRTPTR